MGRIVTTPLDGSMRGPRGQYRASEDNDFLHAENLIHERGEYLRNRPATEDLPIEVLPTDRVIPFEWNGNSYFFIYDPLYEFEWGVNDAYAEPSKWTGSSDSGMYDQKRIGSRYDFVRLLGETGIWSGNSPSQQVLNATAWILAASAPAEAITGTITRNGLGLWLWREVVQQNRHSYDLYYLLSLAMGELRPFHVGVPYSTGREADRLTGSTIRRLQCRWSMGHFWHRFLVVNRSGKVVGNGCTRAMPGTYRPGKAVNDPGVLAQATYDIRNFTYSSRRLPVIGVNNASVRDLAIFSSDIRRYLADVPSREGLFDDIRNPLPSYELIEGVNNFVAVDRSGRMPPLVLEGTPDGSQFVMQELAVKFKGTGQRLHYFPSILSSRELGRYDLWMKPYNPFNRLFEDDKGVGFPSPAEFTSRPGTALLTTANSTRLDNILKEIDFRAWNNNGTQYNKFFRQYAVQRTVGDFPPMDRSSLTLPKDTEAVNSLLQASERKREFPVATAFEWSTYGNCILRYSTEKTATEDFTRAMGGASIEATPYFEQFPVVEYENLSLRHRASTDTAQFLPPPKDTDEDKRLWDKRALWRDMAKKGEVARNIKIPSWYYANREAYLYIASYVLEAGTETTFTEIETICDLEGIYAVDDRNINPVSNCIDVVVVKEKVTQRRPGVAMLPLRFSDDNIDSALKTAFADAVVSQPFLGEKEVSPELYYIDFIGPPVVGLSPDYYYSSVTADSNRYLFAGARGGRNILDVTSTTSDVIKGPEQGVFSFSTIERIVLPARDNPPSLIPYGYTQPLTDEGGIEVYWVTAIGQDTIIGTSKGRIVMDGLGLESLQNAVLDPSDIPSPVPPLVLQDLTYQVMLDRKHIYALERSRERERNTWRSVTGSISDFLFDDDIKSMTALADTGRIVFVTEKGRTYAGLLQPSGDVRWTELSFGSPVREMARITDEIFFTLEDRTVVLRINDDTPIEQGAELSLTLKHPASYVMAGANKGMSSFDTAKYKTGHLLGSFKADDATPEEVRIGTYHRDGTESTSRSITETEFGHVNMHSIRDGLKFSFKARKIEVDSIHMEVTE